MGKPEHSQRGRGPLGVGTTYSMDGRRNVNQDDGGTMGPPLPHPPATTKYFRVWFGWANGHPALYEYEVQTH